MFKPYVYVASSYAAYKESRASGDLQLMGRMYENMATSPVKGLFTCRLVAKGLKRE